MPLDIQITSFPLIDVSDTFLLNFLSIIWPHRVETIFKELRGYQETGEGDRFFWILLNQEIIGITGHYDYDSEAVGLGWHGIVPKYQGQDISKIVIDLVMEDAKKAYPTRQYFIEIIPNENAKLIAHFTRLGFLPYHKSVENFHWLAHATVWHAYYLPLK